jgi:N-acetylglutamate synthase and related acetyltransferases
MSDYVLRKARMSDVREIHALLLKAADEGLLLPRSLRQLYSHLRDFYVVDPANGEAIIGCCALAIIWEGAGEIRSLVVDASHRSKGFGKALTERCIEEARELGLGRVFALTYQVDFFESLSFIEVTKEALPQKVWSDCINCPRFPDCDEHAMLLAL